MAKKKNKMTSAEFVSGFYAAYYPIQKTAIKTATEKIAEIKEKYNALDYRRDVDTQEMKFAIAKQKDIIIKANGAIQMLEVMRLCPAASEFV